MNLKRLFENLNLSSDEMMEFTEAFTEKKDRVKMSDFLERAVKNKVDAATYRRIKNAIFSEMVSSNSIAQAVTYLNSLRRPEPFGQELVTALEDSGITGAVVNYDANKKETILTRGNYSCIIPDSQDISIMEIANSLQGRVKNEEDDMNEPDDKRDEDEYGENFNKRRNGMKRSYEDLKRRKHFNEEVLPTTIEDDSTIVIDTDDPDYQFAFENYKDIDPDSVFPTAMVALNVYRGIIDGYRAAGEVAPAEADDTDEAPIDSAVNLLVDNALESRIISENEADKLRNKSEREVRNFLESVKQPEKKTNNEDIKNRVKNLFGN